MLLDEGDVAGHGVAAVGLGATAVAAGGVAAGRAGVAPVGVGSARVTHIGVTFGATAAAARLLCLLGLGDRFGVGVAVPLLRVAGVGAAAVTARGVGLAAGRLRLPWLTVEWLPCGELGLGCGALPGPPAQPQPPGPEPSGAWPSEADWLCCLTTASLPASASPPMALASPPSPPVASPLVAVVSPPLAVALPPGVTAIELPFPIWVLPVLASPPLPPVAVAAPPVALGSPCVTCETLSTVACTGTGTGGVDGGAGRSRPIAGLAAPNPSAALAATAANSRFMVGSFARIGFAGRNEGSRRSPDLAPVGASQGARARR